MRGGVLCCCGKAAAVASPPSSSLHPLSPSGGRSGLTHLSRRSVSIPTAAEPQVSASDPYRPFLSRRLILLRHAESTIGDRSTRDHDRPLSEVGRADAISISYKLQKMDWVPKLILSSDAARTKETLRIMQEHVDKFSAAEVYFVPSFYSVAAMDGQTAEHLQKAICKYSRDEILTVMCMGHNRGWEEAASMFSGATVELKTCNAALLEASGKSWDEAFALAGLGGWKLHTVVKPN